MSAERNTIKHAYRVLAGEPEPVSKIKDFWQVFWLYKRHNTVAYSARIAYGIAFRGLPF